MCTQQVLTTSRLANIELGAPSPTYHIRTSGSLPHTYVPRTILNNLPYCILATGPTAMSAYLYLCIIFTLLQVEHVAHFLCQVLFRDIHSHSISRSPVVKIDHLNALTLGKLICQESSQIQPPVPTHPKSKDQMSLIEIEIQSGGNRVREEVSDSAQHKLVKTCLMPGFPFNFGQMSCSA